MKKWNFSLIAKITGIVFVAFALVLGNEMRLGIERYMKNYLETDAETTIRSLDKFSKSYLENFAINPVDLSSKQFMNLYQNALSGNDTRVKCLVDKNGKILDLSRETSTIPLLCMIVNSQNEEQPWPAYLDLSLLDNKSIKRLEKSLIHNQDETNIISVDVITDGEVNNDASLSNVTGIRRLKLNNKVIYEKDIEGHVETLEGSVSSCMSQDVEIFFSSNLVESMYTSSYWNDKSKSKSSTLILDYRDIMNSLQQNINADFLKFKNSAKEFKASEFNYAEYFLVPPYKYNGKYYSTVMMRLDDWNLLKNMDNVDDQEIINQITVGYIFVTQEYDHLVLKAFQQYLLDNSSTYILAFILIVGICISIAYLTVKPIRRIENTAKHIARKEFDYPIDMTRHDEIGDLARSIDKMSKELKKTIDNLYQEIERVQKLETIRKEFVSNFTHEIKTPLGIINGFSELIELEQDEKKRNEYIDIIQNETKKINELVLAMLDLSKLESQNVSLSLENIDMLEIVDDCLDSMMYSIEKKNIHLITQLDSSPVFADQFKMEMVVQNFITNAIRYTQEGKTISIVLNEEGFEIENEASAIPEDELEKIWLTFHKVDKSRNAEGTGLGLAICKSILDLHHFDYGVKNTTKGVLFYFHYEKR